ncbi:MAG TPA: hypothetical protein VMI75_02290 [Polyangiaceae bacterium]|nr:hypothetical protein [Polyangiaceae bacterium]
MRMGWLLSMSIAVVLAVGAGAASADAMHPELGARLSGMGEHGIVNLTLKASHHEICWTFDIPTKGVTGASVRDSHGMVVAKLGTRYTKKGCAMVPAKAISTIEAAPAHYRVWVDTKSHPGDLRGALFVGMAHM